jgi:putative serine protease PepD
MLTAWADDSFRFGRKAGIAWKEHIMTEHPQDPDINRDRSAADVPSGAAETTASEPGATAAAGPAENTAAATNADNTTEVVGFPPVEQPRSVNAEQASASVQSNAPQAPQQPIANASNQVTQPTLPYATDAFGRPVAGADGSVPPHFAATAAPFSYAPQGGGPNGPTGPTDARYPKDPARRRAGITLIAALAIGALVGGASGAGVTALVLANQSGGTPVSQAQGASTVVVNNADSVNQVTAATAKAMPSVVTIDATSGTSGGTGSGVVLTSDGYVLTNTHVVTLDGASANATLEVRSSDGKVYKATIVGTDPISDLAVVKLTGASGLTPINWADSGKLNVGDTTIAIGAPLGLSGTVTDGIVSALNRSISIASSAAPTTPDSTAPSTDNPYFWNFDLPNKNGSGQTTAPTAPSATSSISLSVIQTDAAINPGNSGGALLNAKGELIGINVAIANAGGSSSSGTAAGSIGVGFSIPSNLAKRVSDELIANGKATHGLLGASITSATSDTSSTVGALVSDVTSGGAAEKAGLKKGDVVTKFNGVPITDAKDLTAQVRVLASGATAELVYVRGGKSYTVTVTVGELSS